MDFTEALIKTNWKETSGVSPQLGCCAVSSSHVGPGGSRPVDLITRPGQPRPWGTLARAEQRQASARLSVSPSCPHKRHASQGPVIESLPFILTLP